MEKDRQKEGRKALSSFKEKYSSGNSHLVGTSQYNEELDGVTDVFLSGSLTSSNTRDKHGILSTCQLKRRKRREIYSDSQIDPGFYSGLYGRAYGRKVRISCKWCSWRKMGRSCPTSCGGLKTSSKFRNKSRKNGDKLSAKKRR